MIRHTAECFSTLSSVGLSDETSRKYLYLTSSFVTSPHGITLISSLLPTCVSLLPTGRLGFPVSPALGRHLTPHEHVDNFAPDSPLSHTDHDRESGAASADPSRRPPSPALRHAVPSGPPPRVTLASASVKNRDARSIFCLRIACFCAAFVYHNGIREESERMR
jgi:hypothetical protein